MMAHGCLKHVEKRNK